MHADRPAYARSRTEHSNLSSFESLFKQSFHPHSFSPLTVSIALLSTFELGVPKSFITTFLSLHYLLVSAFQSLIGYEPNSVASGIPDTATVVFVFDRSKIIFEEPKPFSLFLTSREALETVSESSCRSTLIQLDQFLKDLIKLIILTVAKSFNHKSLKFNDCRRWNCNSLSLTCRP
jgi:hypothetical protein